MSDPARRWIDELGLAPHPEGGFYRETFRAALSVAAPQGASAASTAIYFLLRAGDFSAFHRVRSDEVWHHYDGAPLELHLLEDDGRHRKVVLGRDPAAGRLPQAVVPAGVWQAARPCGGYALCGCTVAPGFAFADFELPGRAELLRRFPAHRELIRSFTR